MRKTQERARRRSRAAATVIVVLFGLMAFGPAGSAAHFTDLKTFYQTHPSEYAKSRSFDLIVQQEAEPTELTLAEPIEIHIIYPGIQVSDYWRRSLAALNERLTELGIPHRTTTLFTSDDDGLNELETAIGRVMRERPDYLVFTLDSLRQNGLISRILSQGDTKVIVQNITTPIEEFDAIPPLLYVGFDHAVGTRLLAEEYIRRMPPEAHYAIFYGSVGYVSEMRGGTFLREIATRTEFELTAEYYVGFDRERAMAATLELFRSGRDVDFIYAASTDIAHGVADALADLNLRGKVAVNGWGGGGSELEALSKKRIDFTVMRMNDDNGVAIAEAIRLSLEGRGADIPQVYSGSFALIDQSTPKSEIQRLSERAFRYSRQPVH